MSFSSEGKLAAYPAEAIIVFHIFERFAAGNGPGQIVASLARMKVKSSTDKETWNRETIAIILNNEKYVDDMILGKTQAQNGTQAKGRHRFHALISACRRGKIDLILTSIETKYLRYIPRSARMAD